MVFPMFKKILAYISLKRKCEPIDTYGIHKMPTLPTYEELRLGLTHLQGTGLSVGTRQRVWSTITTSCPSAGSLIQEWVRVKVAVVYHHTSMDDKFIKYYANYAPWIYGTLRDVSVDDFLVTENNQYLDSLDFIRTLSEVVESIALGLDMEHNQAWKVYYDGKTKELRRITAEILKALNVE